MNPSRLFILRPVATSLLMVAIIVGVDIAFLRDHPWTRLIVNILIVLLFGAVYLRFLNKS